MRTQKIKSVKLIGLQPTIDLEVDCPDHNFYAEGIVTSNSHSIAYSALAAMTIYLKIHYPKEFFFASLNIITKANDPKKDEKIAKICKELQIYDIPLLPPSITSSQEDFSLEGKGIRYGLGSIKGVSDVALKQLKKFTPDLANKFQLFESVKQSGITIGVLCALIQAGAMGDFGVSRSKMVLEAQLWNLLKPAEKTYCLERGHEYNFDLMGMLKNINDWTGSDGKKVARATRYNTIKKAYEQKGYRDIYKQNSQFEDFANFWYEKSLLGFNYSNSLQSIFKKACPELMQVSEFEQMEDNSTGTFVGVVKYKMDATSRNKKRYTKFILEDGTGSMTAMAFTDTREKLMEEKRIPKEGDIAVFRGRRWQNLLTLDDVSPQGQKIYLKLADLKHDKEDESTNKQDS